MSAKQDSVDGRAPNGSAPWVGRRVRRFEDRRLLTGGGRYVDDVQPAKGTRTLSVAFVRSPHPHARVTRVDVAAARGAPGVVDVVDGAEVAHLTYLAPVTVVKDARRPPYPLIAQDRVRYVGEIVGAVLAESRALARDAADLVEVEYEPLPGVSDPEAALAPDAPLLHEAFGTNEMFRAEGGSPAEAVDAAFRHADHVTSVRLRSPRLASVPIEPRTMLAAWDAGEDVLRIWPSTQRPFGNRADVAALLGLPPDQVHVVARDVGGGFGTKGVPYREEMVLAYLAYKHRDVAVRWAASRSEDFQTMLSSRDQTTHVEGAFSLDGTLQALRVNNVGACGGYAFANTPMPILRVSRLITGAYRVPLARGVSRGAFTNAPPTGPYRGAGRPEGTLLIERLMDVAARELHLDPVEIRRRNFIAPDAFPYQTPTGFTYDSGDYRRTLDHALELADYPRLLAEREAARARGELFGIGVCTFVEPAGGTGFESGRVRVEPDGTVVAESGSFSHGQGHLTTFAQIVADHLGVPADRVRVVQGDTRRVPEGVGTFGSRSTMLGGSALAETADRVLEKMKLVAAHLLETRAEDVEVAQPEGRFHPAGVPSRSVGWAEVAAAAYQPERLPAGLEPGLEEAERFSVAADAWPHGAHVAAVTVDRDTGRVTPRTYVAVDDAGTIINPLLAEGQVMGGLAQGIGQALYEQVVFDEDGTLISGTLGDYVVPRAGDLPPFTLGETVTPSPLNPLGAKGVGEGGTVGAPPAMVGAVVDALSGFGVTHLDMPLTSERVWRAMQASSAT